MLSCAREDNWNYTSDANGQAADGDDRVPLPHGITWADAQHMLMRIISIFIPLSWLT